MTEEQRVPDTHGVTATLLATLDLGPEIEGMTGRQLRMRMFTFEPGAVFGPLHDHKGRPGLVYVLEGTITDHRNGVATDYGPGPGWPEDRHTTHWLENRGATRAIEISVDIVGTRMQGSQFVYVSYIHTSLERLWHALTTPEVIAQYRFGMKVETDWKVGSPWAMYAEGHLMDSGEILESVPQARLLLSWVSEWSADFKAEGHSRCAFELETAGPSVKLTLTHSIDHPNSAFIAAVAEGWPMVLSNLKSVLETGEVALVYHRRHGT